MTTVRIIAVPFKVLSRNIYDSNFYSWYIWGVKINLSHAHQMRLRYLLGCLSKISDERRSHYFMRAPSPPPPPQPPPRRLFFFGQKLILSLQYSCFNETSQTPGLNTVAGLLSVNTIPVAVWGDTLVKAVNKINGFTELHLINRAIFWRHLLRGLMF